MLLAMLFVRYVVKDNIGHGVTKVLLAVSKNESKIKKHNMWTSMAASSVTIGFGGSVGAEAPIVYTGAAIGSNVARYMGLSYKNTLNGKDLCHESTHHFIIHTGTSLTQRYRSAAG